AGPEGVDKNGHEEEDDGAPADRRRGHGVAAYVKSPGRTSGPMGRRERHRAGFWLPRNDSRRIACSTERKRTGARRSAGRRVRRRHRWRTIMSRLRFRRLVQAGCLTARSSALALASRPPRGVRVYAHTTTQDQFGPRAV